MAHEDPLLGSGGRGRLRSSQAVPEEAGSPGLALLGYAILTGDTFHAVSTDCHIPSQDSLGVVTVAT